MISKETKQGNFTLKVIEYVTVVVDAVVEKEDSSFCRNCRSSMSSSNTIKVIVVE